jgi:ankyrin repeat protein
MIERHGHIDVRWQISERVNGIIIRRVVPDGPCIFSRLIIIHSSRKIASSPTYHYRLHHRPFLALLGCKQSIFLRRKKESMNRIERELIEAAKENNLPEVSRLLSVGADVNARDGIIGDTPLDWASMMGYVQVVKELVEHGANTEAKNNLGDTPLHNASGEGHLPVVKALLAVGANILAVNEFLGFLPVQCAMMYGHSAVSKCLLQQMYATTSRPLPLHKLLQDLTWKRFDSNDIPPLRAALADNVLSTDDVVEIIEYLVDQNPDSLASCDQDGSLPLHVACHRGAAFTIVQFLVNRYGASVKSMTPQGDLPLFLACKKLKPSLDTIFFLMKQNPMCDVVYR